MSGRKAVSPEEIERRLIADAENPDAWEPIGTVEPSRSPRPAWYGQSADRTSRSRLHPNDERFNRIRAQKSASRTAQVVRIEDARAKRHASARRPSGYAEEEPEAVRRKRLHDAIADLSEGQRRAIQLWLDGFSYTDIAGALGVSVDAVKSRLRDAKRHLQTNLHDRHDMFRDYRAGGTNER